MKIIINYDKNDKEYKLYNKDLDVYITSDKMFKVLVLFNSYLSRATGESINILDSDKIEYVLDSYSMKSMIDSNVSLLKKMSSFPSEFQLSNDKFGNSNNSSLQFRKRDSSNSKFKEYDKMSKMKSNKKCNKL